MCSTVKKPEFSKIRLVLGPEGGGFMRFYCIILLVRSEVLTETSMKKAVFWDVAPCCLVHTDVRFEGAYCLHHQSDEFISYLCIFSLVTRNEHMGRLIKNIYAFSSRPNLLTSI
jgi:hypothetical protein